MPKMKTVRGAKKRVRVTASGKLKRHHAFKSHIAKSKSPKRRCQLRRPAQVADVDYSSCRKMEPYIF